MLKRATLPLPKKFGFEVEVRWGIPVPGEPWKEKTHVCTFPFETSRERDAFLMGFDAATRSFAVKTRRASVTDMGALRKQIRAEQRDKQRTKKA